MGNLTALFLQRQRRYGKPRFLKLLYMAIASVVALFLVLLATFVWLSRNLPEPGKIERRSGFSTTFYDRNGKIIHELYKDQNRIPVDLDEISAVMKQATIAIEDKDFYRHGGFSSRGILRALFSSIIRRRLEGGSTLTQQLIKNVLLTSERTVTRKIKEFVLAVEVERRYSKDEILELYLNEAPYGGTFWGVEAAAKGYFGKSAKDLNLVEAAFLAGLPQRPSYYSPFIGEKKAYVGRTAAVLRRMREDGYIGPDEEKKSLDLLNNLVFERPKVSFTAPHFIFYVYEQINELLGKDVVDRGIKVVTTIDLDIQKQAEEIISEEIEKIKSLNATNGAAVVLNTQTGEILAMVGSYDYNNEDYGRYNTALAFRQPGSAIKPITYAAALTRGYTAATTVMDVKTTFPDQGDKDYIPENYDGKFRGPTQLRFALGNSINIPAVKVLAMVGIKNFLSTAAAFGLDTFSPTQENMNRFGLSITLGGGETRLLDLTRAYAAIGRGGVYKDHTSVLEVKDYRNHTLYKAKKPLEKRVISDGIAFILSHILSDNNARRDVFGTSSFLNIPGKTVAVKTGTSNDKRDNWTLGFTKEVTAGVWVGNNNNTPMNQKIVSGVTGASPIWHRLMRQLLKKYKDGIIEKPDSVVAMQIDAYLGGLPKDGYPIRSEYFVKGTEPTDVSPFYKKIKLSRSNGKLANDLEVRLGEYDEKEFVVISENDPISKDGRNRWQEAIDQWTVEQSNDKFHPPKEISQSRIEDTVVQIREPQDKSRVNSNAVKIKVRITSEDPINKIEVFINGAIVKTYTGDSDEIEDFITLSNGIYELRVRAENSKGKSGDSIVKIGVNQDFIEATPTP